MFEMLSMSKSDECLHKHYVLIKTGWCLSVSSADGEFQFSWKVNEAAFHANGTHAVDEHFLNFFNDIRFH